MDPEIETLFTLRINVPQAIDNSQDLRPPHEPTVIDLTRSNG